jgi:hypothetical protein
MGSQHMNAKSELIKMLLDAPDNQLDAAMNPYIEKWSDPPTPIQVLEVLDLCINGSLCSGLVVTVLQVTYDNACKDANTTHEEMVKSASWREHPSFGGGEK